MRSDMTSVSRRESMGVRDLREALPEESVKGLGDFESGGIGASSPMLKSGSCPAAIGART